ncbi:MAG: hypothetical protein H7A31_03475 [Thermotogae bacterium]|nr:hypothetical protein [Thermotogota bacterium]MCP5465737.1 hypothetical protein [Thermotogota bacterium]HOO73733.1 hypothetical protein [Tepiditoga sp.]
MNENEYIKKIKEVINPEDILIFINKKDKNIFNIDEKSYENGISFTTEEGKTVFAEFEIDNSTEKNIRSAENYLKIMLNTKQVPEYFIFYLGKGIPLKIILTDNFKFNPEYIVINQYVAGEIFSYIKKSGINSLALISMPLMRDYDESLMNEHIDFVCTDKRIKKRTEILKLILIMIYFNFGEEFYLSLKVRIKNMFKIDIFEDERKNIFDEIKEKQDSFIEEGIKIGEEKILREKINVLFLKKFGTDYDEEIRSLIKMSDKDKIDYIFDNIFDLEINEIKEYLR